ncbi:hypothetical protein FEE95_05835 [Maribacter algarum]|uniref:Membrane protein involved in the export of O-antigen and teichoic acid n=1 Tax=Maribacter algarum (ex Zhang et al. 2020) TaxID=2578118 RepID=A0A5S3PXJ0_9FLAO|nr:oligosaccharide flippase family protein [Maribacter algarum]TMM58952.1 hypothetical protein FEE95_05835 [Maribacter algarum]
MRNVSSQMIGTGIAQALPFAVTPILTRLYSEKEFALYTSFFAIAGVFEVVSGGRYQFAIVIPKEEDKANRIFALSIYLTILYSVLLFLVTLVVPEDNGFKIGKALYFVPLHVLFFGIWSSFSNLSIRHKTFKDNAVAKVLQSFFYVLTSIGLGLTNFTLYGLVVGKITGFLSSWVYLFKRSNIKAAFVQWSSLKGVAKEYIDYPKYGIIPTFLNTISIQAIILVLAKFYGTDDLGHFGLTTLVLGAPMGLIGASFKDVFYQKIAYMINTDGAIDLSVKFFKKSALGLFAIGLPICAILYFFGPQLFSFVFGDTWERAGTFASILAFSFLVKLVASPLSSVFNAVNRLKIASIWQTFYFITTFITLGICAYYLKLDVETLFLVYVVHECILYGLYLVLQYKTLKGLKP